MKEAYWGYWLVILGVFVIVIMLLIQNVTSNNTEDYYTVRQISEAAMLDAVDYAYYREYGEVKINKEKFIENFLRRFGEAASTTTDYKVLFTAIYEAPPKVSVEITSKTEKYIINTDTDPNSNDGTSFDISNRIDAILELGGSNNELDGFESNKDSDSDVKITNKDAAKNLKTGDTPTFIVSAKDTSKCTWSSNNTGVATVDANGKVTIHNDGIATVTVKCENKSDSVEIVIDNSTGDCTGWLESFSVDAPNDKFEAGKTYTAKMVYIAQPPEGKTGTCILKKSGIEITEPFGLNESTGEYNSTFEGDNSIEIDIEENKEAEVEVTMTFKVPNDYKGQEFKLRAWVSNLIYKEITLKK